MSAQKHPVLFWLPRSLGIAMALFLALFAFDTFDRTSPWWFTLLNLVVHLIPTLLIMAMVTAAWKKPKRGALIFLFAGIFMTAAQIQNARGNIPLNILCLAGPLFLIGYLYFFESAFSSPN